MYLFQNDNSNWEVLIGSANFTKFALSRNTEVSILLSSKDENSEENYKKIKSFIDESFKSLDSNCFYEHDLQEYISKQKKYNPNEIDIYKHLEEKNDMANISSDSLVNTKNNEIIGTSLSELAKQKKDFIKENGSNIGVIRKYIAEILDKNHIPKNIKYNSDGNISILVNGNLIASIDLLVECKYYGHPVIRFRYDISTLFDDSRIVPFYKDKECEYSKRNGEYDGEKYDIGIKDISSFKLVLKILRKITIK